MHSRSEQGFVALSSQTVSGYYVWLLNMLLCFTPIGRHMCDSRHTKCGVEMPKLVGPRGDPSPAVSLIQATISIGFTVAQVFVDFNAEHRT